MFWILDLRQIHNLQVFSPVVCDSAFLIGSLDIKFIF